MARREREQAKDFGFGVITGGGYSIFDAGGKILGSIAKDEKKSSIAIGAATGAYFGGPVGAFLGAGVGGVLGFSASKKRQQAEFEQYQKNLKLSYEIGESTVGGIRNTREGIEKTYQSNLASSRAQFAARGAQVGGASWDTVVGQHVKERDEALSKVSEQEAEFRKSDAAQYINRDRDLAFLQGGKRSGFGQTYGMSPTSGERFISKELSDKVHYINTDPGEGDPVRGLMEFRDEYYGMIAPTYEEFETLRFGTDEERSAIQSEIGQRIDVANKRYDDFMALRDLEQKNRFEEGYY